MPRGTNSLTRRAILMSMVEVLNEEYKTGNCPSMLPLDTRLMFSDDFLDYITGKRITMYATDHTTQIYRIRGLKDKTDRHLCLLTQTMARAIWIAEAELKALEASELNRWVGG